MPKVPHWVTKCVAFVGSAPRGSDITIAGGPGLRLRGTAFYIMWPVPGRPDRHVVFAITAKHVINGIQAVNHQGYLRRPWMLQPAHVADRFSPAIWLEYRYDDWVQHPDPMVDAAIMLVDSIHTFDMSSINPKAAVTPAIMNSENIGVGDEVFITGLFVSHPGAMTNVPIVRVGNIATLDRSEKVSTTLGQMDALLIEARSIGGLSGSPVFVHLGIARIPRPGAPGTWAIQPEGVFYWLGLVHGHFDGGLSLVDEAQADAVSMNRERVNMGIAIVVPADRILEIFEEQRVKDVLAQVAQASLARAESDRNVSQQ